MKYCQLGRSGLTVSRLCLGTLNFGPETSEEDSHTIMDRAHQLGLNHFDSSNVYGWKRGDGWTEQIIGRWFAQGRGRRERTVLGTKVYEPTSDWPNDGRLSARHIRQACDDSLRRLKTDYIDIYQMHHVDRNTPWDEIWEAMDVLRTQGKILYVGSSNFAGWHLAQAQDAATARSMLGLISEQSIYNLATRDIEREVIPAAQAYGIGVLAWSPLHRGMLAGVLRSEVAATRYKPEHLAKHRAQLEQYEALCDEIGAEPAQLALAWLLSRPGLTSPVIGPQSVKDLDSAVAALDIHLDDAVLTRLDEIFPGYLPAPEDYAW
ncbi:aldo/keto reductase [Streptomyces sp. NBC_01775]|uniref:aldo/keto reductase n=1 Tax=Streptomyces sp. NBC_01775 TaxID=2975939 RepID=UPI002DD7E64B|nr:aldo/keto reductase [Streptomyces sp. NBC_01775]WSB74943.1 aldo/keto reductase [Streptomyces sp. NBC_01775]